MPWRDWYVPNVEQEKSTEAIADCPTETTKPRPKGTEGGNKAIDPYATLSQTLVRKSNTYITGLLLLLA